MRIILPKASAKFTIYFTVVIMSLLGILAILANSSSLYSAILKCIIFLSLVFPLAKLIEIYISYFINYMFCIPNIWWIKEVQRPRLLFNILGIIVIGFSVKSLVFMESDINNFAYVSYIIISIGTYLVGISLIVLSWTPFFEKELVKKVRRKLIGFNDIKCIISEKYDIDKIIKEINDLEKDENKLQCNISSFIALTKLEELKPEERIQSSFEKSQLIRLVYILFNLNKEIKPALKRELINSYFVNTEGESIILEQESLFSRIDNEIVYSKDKFIEYKDCLLSVFHNNRKV